MALNSSSKIVEQRTGLCYNRSEAVRVVSEWWAVHSLALAATRADGDGAQKRGASFPRASVPTYLKFRRVPRGEPGVLSCSWRP